MKLKKLLLGTALTAGTVFAVGTTSANADEVYTIQSNDTLAKISQNFVGDKGLVDSIVDANGIQDKNMIYEGEQLTIPTDGDNAEQQAPVQEEAPAQEQQAPVQEQQPVQEEQQPAEEPAPEAVEEPAQEAEPAPEPATSNDGGGSTKEQFLAAGGTEEMWSTIVMPESGGDPNAVNPIGYQGLGQTKEPWGTGSVEEQTKGMVNYAIDRYGSVEEAVSFRSSNNWW